jgi:hypothetical protein
LPAFFSALSGVSIQRLPPQAQILNDLTASLADKTLPRREYRLLITAEKRDDIANPSYFLFSFSSEIPPFD